MNKESISEMIERQGVYEIEYKREEDVNIRHISNILFSPEYGDSYIFAYCHEASKELTFDIRKIISIQEYWVGILSKDATVPNDGTFLVARCGLGQGIDIEYELLELKEGEQFETRELSWDKPIAYHYISPFGIPESNWIKKEIIMKKWENVIIPAPNKGIPVIAYSEPQKDIVSQEAVSIDFCIGNGFNMSNRVYSGVRKNDDISTFFKKYDNAGPFGWSERWDDYRILGYVMISEYDIYACRHHVEQRLKMEPDFF